MEITNGPFARLADIVAQALQFRNVAKQVLLITMVSKNVKHLLRTGRFIRSTRRRLREHLRKSEPELHLGSAGIVTVGCVRHGLHRSDVGRPLPVYWTFGRSKEQYISAISPIIRRQEPCR